MIRYFLKALPPEISSPYGVKPAPQGPVYGKRCGHSETFIPSFLDSEQAEYYDIFKKACDGLPLPLPEFTNLESIEPETEAGEFDYSDSCDAQVLQRETDQG